MQAIPDGARVAPQETPAERARSEGKRVAQAPKDVQVGAG
jgi:hypothetical protein